MAFHINQFFSINCNYDVFFTRNIFYKHNRLLCNIILGNYLTGFSKKKIVVLLDHGVFDFHHYLINDIIRYFDNYSDKIFLCCDPILLKGGEAVKNNTDFLNIVYNIVNDNKICRHSYIIAIGGGSFLDMVGYAASTSHRGVRLIRIPTTVLSQNDSGVGVKNGINYFFKKNFLGNFSYPFSVLNDSNFLFTLNFRDWIAGVSEAIKVSLIKDSRFFYYINFNSYEIRKRNLYIMNRIIYNCAQLHMDHIKFSGDPYEVRSGRPLDFGHWLAHKLEVLSFNKINHGEAVAIGIVLDCIYSYLISLLSIDSLLLIINLFYKLGQFLYISELDFILDINCKEDIISNALNEFQEHLGGDLSIVLLRNIGFSINVDYIDVVIYKKGIFLLKEYCFLYYN